MLIRIATRLLAISLSFVLYITPVYADPNPSPTPYFGPGPGGLFEIEQLFGSVISVIVSLGFIGMLVMIVMAGFKYVTSGGEPKALQAAHQTLMWALLGVVFLAVAWIILQLIANFTGLSITVFNVRTLCGENNKFCPTPPPTPH